MARLQINVGRMHKVTPRELVEAIAGESGIPGRSIGAIDIRERCSVVEIAADMTERVETVLNGGVFICEIKVTASPDEGTAPCASTRPSPPKPRPVYR